MSYETDKANILQRGSMGFNPLGCRGILGAVIRAFVAGLYIGVRYVGKRRQRPPEGL